MRERVYVVIVNFRGADDVLSCVSSLGRSRHLDATVVVVDNGSADGSVETLRRELPSIHVFDTDRNLGFAGGANVAVRYALEHGAAHVWLLNPDTTVEPGSLGYLVETLESNPGVGIVGSRVLRGGSEPLRIWADGGVIDWDRGAATSHQAVGESPSSIGEGEVRPIDYATGASMLVRRQVFEDIGVLPERYFLYFEETHFNVEARQAGWEIVLDPRSVVIHNQRSHSTLPSPHYVYYFVRNRILFGSHFSEAPLDDLERYAREWARDWRIKVSDRAPSWLGTFDQLVELAVNDARAGREGQRPDISDVPHPGADRDG